MNIKRPFCIHQGCLRKNEGVRGGTEVLEPNQPLVLFGVGRSVDSLDSSDGAADPGA